MKSLGSKVAEAILCKLGKSEVRSAGVRIDILRPYVAESVLKVLKEKGYSIGDEKSRRVDDYLVKWADRIIIVADIENLKDFLSPEFSSNKILDTVSPALFPKEKTEVWEIEDCDESENDKIMKKMEKLLLIVIKLVNKIDMREFVLLKVFGEESREFSFWFNDIVKDRVKPPLLLVT